MPKKWFKILAPKIFNKMEIGQSLSEEGKDLLGRTISLPLSTLLGDRSRHYVIVKLKIVDAKEGKAFTEIKSMKISRSYLVRYVRRRTSRVDSIDDVVTKDGKRMRIKSLLVTAFKAKRRQRYSLRKALSEEVKKRLKEYTADAFVLSVSVGKFQATIKKKLSKIYPLRFSEIRVIEMKD